MASSFLKDIISLFSNSSTIQWTEHKTVIPDSWSMFLSFGLRGWISISDHKPVLSKVFAAFFSKT